MPFRIRRQVCKAQHVHVSPTSAHPASATWWQPVYASESVRDRKSVFLAHATRLSTTQEVPTFIKHLTSLPELKRATHCMYAYRISNMQTLCGQQDGGEGGSGDRLSRLLDLSGAENVIVVVSRWYGGIPLGSDRWKRISTVAKEALAKGGFLGKSRDKHLKAQTKKNKK